MKSLFQNVIIVLTLLICARAFSTELGDNNPTGVAGEFNGNVTTGGSYDPFTGNATRSITDIVVPGAVGAYPLAFTRTMNSRVFDPNVAHPFGVPGNWRYSYQWEIAPWFQSSSSNTVWQTLPNSYAVTYPDGRKVVFVTDGSGYWRGPAGIGERFIPPTTNPTFAGATTAQLLLPDGGVVTFDVVISNDYDNPCADPCAVNCGHPLCQGTDAVDPDPANITYTKTVTASVKSITDPYGQVTTITSTTTGMVISEPGGRSLTVLADSTYPYLIREVDERSASGPSSPITRRVQYGYQDWSWTGTPSSTPTTALTSVNYFDGYATAYYHYQPNYSYQTTVPLIAECDDPMFEGPMKRINYEMTQPWFDGVDHVYAPGSGQIFAEHYWSGSGGAGGLVSTLTMNPAAGTRTETRPDGTYRTFTYSGGYLTQWTDFQSHVFKREYDDYGFVKSYTDPRGAAYTTTMTRDSFSGNVTSVTHPVTPSDGTAQTVTYDYAGTHYYVMGVIDENNHHTIYTRDPDRSAHTNKITDISYPDGGSEHFTYNSFGQVLTHTLRESSDTEPAGVETFQYDTHGRLLYHWAPSATQYTQYTYYDDNSANTDRVYRVKDPLGRWTKFEYNLRGQTTKVTHEVDGTWVQNSYNDYDGTLHWTTDENHMGGAQTIYSYDDYKRITQVTNPMGETSARSYSAWNAAGSAQTGDPYAHTDTFVFRETRNNKYVDQNWDSNRRLAWVRTAPAVAGEQAMHFYDRDEVGNLTGMHDPRNYDWVTSYKYDARNRKIKEIPPLVAENSDQVTEWTYDPASNQIKQLILPNKGNGARPKKVFAYDNVNRLSEEHVWEDAGANDTERVTYYQHYHSGALKSVQDPKGQLTSFTYDGRNRKKSMSYPYEQNPHGAQQIVSEFKYDEVDRLLERPTADPSATQTFSYDDANHKVHMRWSNAVDFADFTYDPAGRLISAVNPYSTITRQYDDANRLRHDIQTLTTSPASPASPITTLLSAVSRKIQGTRPDPVTQQPVPNVFDIQLLPTAETESRGGGSYSLVLTFQDPVTISGASVASGYGSVTGKSASANTVTIDLANVATAQTITVNAIVTTGGQTGQVTVPMRVLVGDANGDGGVNSADVTLIRNASGQSADSANYRCDLNADGFIQSADSTIVRGQSGSVMPAGPSTAPSVDVAFTPNADGQVEQLRAAGFYSLGFHYDATRRLKTIDSGYGGPPAYEYFYDFNSNVTGRQTNSVNGTGTTFGLSFGYDERNRVKERTISANWYDVNDANAPWKAYSFSNEQYGYDPLNRVTRVDRDIAWGADGSHDHKADGYSYNDRGELTNVQYRGTANGSGGVDSPEKTWGVTPDRAGNWSSVNNNGSLAGYSANNLNEYEVTTNSGAEHEVTAYNGVSYRHLADGQLAAVTKGSSRYNLGYDALGRCVRRINGSNSSAATTYYVYAQAQPIIEYADSTGNGSLAVAAYNVYGKGVDEILSRTAAGETFYYLQDRQGSVTALTNGSGQIVEQYSYDAWGTPEIRTAPTTGNPRGSIVPNTAFSNRFLFTGREWASNYGFYEYRARAYQPALGRFISEDPLSFAGGDSNLFRYCGGDPVNRIDPFGLKETPQSAPYRPLEAVTGPITVEATFLQGDPAEFNRDANGLDFSGGAAGEGGGDGGRGDGGGGVDGDASAGGEYKPDPSILRNPFATPTPPQRPRFSLPPDKKVDLPPPNISPFNVPGLNGLPFTNNPALDGLLFFNFYRGFGVYAPDENPFFYGIG